MAQICKTRKWLLYRRYSGAQWRGLVSWSDVAPPPRHQYSSAQPRGGGCAHHDAHARWRGRAHVRDPSCWRRELRVLARDDVRGHRVCHAHSHVRAPRCGANGPMGCLHCLHYGSHRQHWTSRPRAIASSNLGCWIHVRAHHGSFHVHDSLWGAVY